MNKFVKVLFLLTTLAIPVFIFIFLKVMGSNKFNIPVYYQEKANENFTDCGISAIPYQVPDSLLEGSTANIVYFYDNQSGDLNEVENQYLRINDTFGNERQPAFVVYADTVLTSGHLKNIRNVKGHLKHILNCGFKSDTTGQYILVDKNKRIRGYYDSDLDEQDRLIVEIKILNENGDNK